MNDLVSIIGAGGELSLQISDALMHLIRDGGELGELDQQEIIDPNSGERRMVKCVPPAWLRRLAKAAEVGAFDRYTPQDVARRILTTTEAT